MDGGVEVGVFGVSLVVGDFVVLVVVLVFILDGGVVVVLVGVEVDVFVVDVAVRNLYLLYPDVPGVCWGSW